MLFETVMSVLITVVLVCAAIGSGFTNNLGEIKDLPEDD